MINPNTPQEERLFSKTAQLQRRQEEVLSICAAGGGGYGDPKQRDAERVQQDVAAGFVSPEAATQLYGVSV